MLFLAIVESLCQKVIKYAGLGRSKRITHKKLLVTFNTIRIRRYLDCQVWLLTFLYLRTYNPFWWERGYSFIEDQKEEKSSNLLEKYTFTAIVFVAVSFGPNWSETSSFKYLRGGQLLVCLFLLNPLLLLISHTENN